MLRIVIPGGTGQVGTILARHFRANGHAITTIARHGGDEQWNALPATVDGADVVINLAGRSVNCRYNETNRREILESRVQATRAVGDAIRNARRPPCLWMNASTATIYRHAMDRPMDEATGEIGGAEPGAPSSWRFSIAVATAWEKAFYEAQAPPEVRKVALRSAMVMSPDRGGVFDTRSG